MAQPYSTRAQVGNQVIDQLATQAGWSDPSDFNSRIQEGDSVIDSRLASMGYPLPFSGTNPPLLLQLSVLHGRYACLRDLYAGNTPSQAPSNAMQSFKDRFEELMIDLETGQASLVDSTGAVVSRWKGDVVSPNVGVVAFFNMDKPENLTNDADPTYTDPNFTG